ncbi:MAG: hypothetical protein ACK41O_26425, partial [Runella zeae]
SPLPDASLPLTPRRPLTPASAPPFDAPTWMSQTQVLAYSSQIHHEKPMIGGARERIKKKKKKKHNATNDFTRNVDPSV